LIKVSIIAPHCDDETLGCGGLLLKLKKKNVATSVIFVSEHNSKKLDLILKKIEKKYNLKKIYRLKYEPSTLDLLDKRELIEKIKRTLYGFKTTDLYLPNPDDIHSDHFHCYKASLSASKWFRNKFIKNIFIYETLSESEILSQSAFTPNVFVDITSHIKEKIKIANYYTSEIKKFPFPRSSTSIDSLAKYRGSSCGYKYAEAFKLIFSKK
jgi:LmbE family N-acetylglucosaminyl deacetylase